MNWQRWIFPMGGAIAGLGITAVCPLALSRAESKLIPLPVPAPLPIPVRPRPIPVGLATFNSQQLDQQYRTYLHYLSEVGTPDILIVGSSRALQGIDPLVLRQELAKQGHPPLKIYNFGINGATAQVVELLLTQLLTPAQLPRLILWADGARAFNSGRIDQTHRHILASPGYQQVRAGLHPMLSAGAIAVKPCPEIQAAAKSQVAIAPAPLPLPPPVAAPESCQSPLALLTQPHPVISPTLLPTVQRALGFQPFTTRFNPTRYFQRYPQVPGAYDGDYRQFSLAGRQTQALQNVLAFTQIQNIPVLFVNLPMTRIYLDWTRSDYEGEFRAYMQAYAGTGKLRFYDLGQRWLTRYDYFMDPSHLNREGAATVATQLANSITPEMSRLY